MANGFGSRRRPGIKLTEEDKVLTGTGQNVEQDSPIIKKKALEQQLVRGARTKGSTLGREVTPFSESQLTPGERFKLDAPVGAKKKIPGEQGGTLAKLDEPRKPGPLKSGEGRLTVTSERPGGAKRTGRGGITELSRGVQPEQPVGGGINFNIADFKGIENIFSSAGNLAAFFSSPAFQAQQFKARGARARKKGIAAQTKNENERVKALSTALENIPDIEGNEGVRNLLTTQITDIITKKDVKDDPVVKFATLAKSRGFKRGEIEDLATRLFKEGEA